VTVRRLAADDRRSKETAAVRHRTSRRMSPARLQHRLYCANTGRSSHRTHNNFRCFNTLHAHLDLAASANLA
jgi:hypothetical protein